MSQAEEKERIKGIAEHLTIIPGQPFAIEQNFTRNYFDRENRVTLQEIHLVIQDYGIIYLTIFQEKNEEKRNKIDGLLVERIKDPIISGLSDVKLELDTICLYPGDKRIPEVKLTYLSLSSNEIFYKGNIQQDSGGYPGEYIIHDWINSKDEKIELNFNPTTSRWLDRIVWSVDLVEPKEEK